MRIWRREGPSLSADSRCTDLLEAQAWPIDCFTRALDINGLATGDWQNLSSDGAGDEAVAARKMLAAYAEGAQWRDVETSNRLGCAGVNWAVEHAVRDLPLEFHLTK